jgi:hypothetical protein
MKSVLAILLLAFAVVSTSAFGGYTPVFSNSASVRLIVPKNRRRRDGCFQRLSAHPVEFCSLFAHIFFLLLEDNFTK